MRAARRARSRTRRLDARDGQRDDVAGPLGPGARAALLLLDHQGPAGRVRAARRVRAQPPQGAAPGGADLARRPRLHARRSRCSTRRTTCTRTRRPGIPYEHVPLGRHDELADRARRDLRARSRAGSTIPTEKVLIHHEEFGDRLLGVLAGYLLYAGLVDRGPARDRRRSRSITGRELGAAGREIVAITVNEDIVARRAASPELTHGHDRDRGAARARRARRAARGAEPAAAVRGRRRARRSTSRTAGASDDLDDTVDYSAVSGGGEPGGEERALPAARAAGHADRRGVPHRRARAPASPSPSASCTHRCGRWSTTSPSASSCELG